MVAMPAVAMPTAALPEEAEVASMAADPAVAEVTVAEVTLAEVTVADTGKELQARRSFDGWQHGAASYFSLVDVQSPHPDFHFSARP